jgi:lipoprotein-anchoring transpeptidase ErfK/SrfK
LPTNQGGLSGRGLYRGCGSGRHWAADPLHHSYHAGAGSAADSTQTIAESQSATGGGLQGKQFEIRAASAAVGSGCAAAAGERQSAAYLRRSRTGRYLSGPRHCPSPANADDVGAAGCNFGATSRGPARNRSGQVAAAEFRRTIIDYPSKEPAGTIIIDTPHTYLYLVLGNGKAMRYGIGVGREGFTWSGAEKVTKMAEWPDWHPPEGMIERQPYLPRFMAGGEGNPLGARALYLGQTLYRIHGTNQPSTIGTFVSSGCIRLTNEDIADLYGRVRLGTRVVVLPGASPAPVQATPNARPIDPLPQQRPKAIAGGKSLLPRPRPACRHKPRRRARRRARAPRAQSRRRRLPQPCRTLKRNEASFLSDEELYNSPAPARSCSSQRDLRLRKRQGRASTYLVRFTSR